MKKSLIKELDELENKHWWHKAKRNIFTHYINKEIEKSKNKLKILEIGAGAGNILAQFKDKAEVIALDPDDSAIEYCKKRGITKTIKKTLETYKPKPGSIDIVIAADVIEHIKDDKKAVKKIWEMLKKDGLLIVHVPADQSLFSYWDEQLGHYRRYSKKQLQKLFDKKDYETLVIRHRVNALYPFVKFFRKIKGVFIDDGSEAQSDFKSFSLLNDALFGLTTLEDKLSRKNIHIPFGLSLFTIARKK